jgi:tRNA threonylcarbamoyladenosine biosynthesis protein TsaE
MASGSQILSFKHQISTHSVEATKTLGKSIGMWITSGTVLALSGDLGSGKTSFVQGLARGLEVPDDYYITSPSYTLINEYPGRLPLFHIDLYRISDITELEDIGFYEILCGNVVVAIEWADRIGNGLLPGPINIHFEITRDETRKIYISANKSNDLDLLKKIKDFEKNLRESL